MVVPMQVDAVSPWDECNVLVSLVQCPSLNLAEIDPMSQVLIPREPDL